MKELRRLLRWKERFLKEYPAELPHGVRKLSPLKEGRFLLALAHFVKGGREERLREEEVLRWALFGAKETYETFGGFKSLSEKELSFTFWVLGKLFVPLLLHERGVLSEAFRSLREEEKERAVREELESLWETQLPLILSSLEFLGLKRTSS